MSFSIIKKAVQEKYKSLSSGSLFYVDINRDQIFEEYLNGFSEEEKQGHNCNCCKSFLRQYGGIVAIIDNKMVSIWDLDNTDKLNVPDIFTGSMYNLSKYIHSLPITDVFLSPEKKAGTDKNKDGVRDIIWEHFYLELDNKFVVNGSTIAEKKSEFRDNKTTFKRALDELKIDGTEAVLELIAQGSLYRGNEFKPALVKFLQAQKEYATIPNGLKDNYVWTKSLEVGGAICKIRNSAIGTLLIDISAGFEIDECVTAFEKVVAPTNYKRPAPIITPKIVEEAEKLIDTLGYKDSLERRFATDVDLNINNLLFTDRSSELTDIFKEMKKDVTVNPKAFSKIEEISIEKFISEVLPTSKSVEVLLENSHLANMVSLITSDEPKSMFKWSNPFSWSYTGGITDSIKEKVKAAGGKVDGYLRVSLAWHNYDDLDLHVVEPGNNRIMYSNPRSYKSGGNLDVDMNAGGGKSRQAVENIVFPIKSKMLDGTYSIQVNQFAQREKIDQGYTIQVECEGVTYEFEETISPSTGKTNPIVNFTYSAKDGFKIAKEGKQAAPVVKEKWNLKTNQFVRVKKMMLSPNFWNEQIGNKHYLFMLEDCIADEDPRPFFNEFLKDELLKNKRVFEVLASKLRVPKSSAQLSGIGFSDTLENSVIVRVEGKIKRNLRIRF